VASAWTVKDNPSNETGSKQSSIYCVFHAKLLLDLLFNPEDGDEMFIMNVS
jgi:hypothetical protein